MVTGKHEVVIDGNLCIGCGECERDCVAGVIAVRGGKAQITGAGCISCGHCEAVCPRGAVALTGFDEESEPFAGQTRLDPRQLMEAIRTRRSVRRFTPEPIADGVLAQIIEAGRLAPTGSNSQDTGYIVLADRIGELEAMAVQMFRRLAGAAKPFVPFLRDKVIDERFFFKGAPVAVVITGSAVNASLAAENMAFMAEANGLGVLFSGFFTVCANRNNEIRKVLGMGKREKAVTTLVIGHPAVRYRRTAKREAAKVRRV